MRLLGLFLLGLAFCFFDIIYELVYRVFAWCLKSVKVFHAMALFCIKITIFNHLA
jgi:hypothetical protein